MGNRQTTSGLLTHESPLLFLTTMWVEEMTPLSVKTRLASESVTYPL